MTRTKVILSSVVVAALACSAALYAQRPAENIDPHRHPALAEAQRHIMQAWDKTAEAMKANKEELGGHAYKAQQLLEQADHELKEAAEVADHRK